MTPRILPLLVAVGLVQAALAQSATLVNTFTKPTSPADDAFGISVAAVGSERRIIGAHKDATGAPSGAGMACLFALTPPAAPTLTIVPAAPGNATISWTPNTPGFVLQETELLSPANWTNSLSEAANPTLAPTTLPAKYFRLRQP